MPRHPVPGRRNVFLVAAKDDPPRTELMTQLGRILITRITKTEKTKSSKVVMAGPPGYSKAWAHAMEAAAPPGLTKASPTVASAPAPVAAVSLGPVQKQLDETCAKVSKQYAGYDDFRKKVEDSMTKQTQATADLTDELRKRAKEQQEGLATLRREVSTDVARIDNNIGEIANSLGADWRGEMKAMLAEQSKMLGGMMGGASTAAAGSAKDTRTSRSPRRAENKPS